MSVYATILALDGDHTDQCPAWATPPGPCTGCPGPPYHYFGAHVLPAPSDSREGFVQLAAIPGHITRDARDDQPDDLAPWPWLRLSVSADDVVLDEDQAKALRDALTGWLDSRAGG